MRHRFLARALVGLVLAGLACASPRADEGGGDNIAPSGKCTQDSDCPGAGQVCHPDTGSCSALASFTPADHPAPPILVTTGGPVLANPRIVPIFYANEDASIEEELTDFESRIGASNYWAVLQEYGVGAATTLPVVKLSESAPRSITDDTMQAWLATKISNHTLPTPDENTIYVLHFPAGTTVDDGSGSISCDDFAGYHYNFTLRSGLDVAYAVIPNCESDGLSLIDALSTTVSHELAEAATDPYPETDPAFEAVDDAHFFWDAAMYGSEIADLCENDASNYVQLPELPHMVQLLWSNKAAQAGHNPCQPWGAPFFAAVPELDEDVSYRIDGQTYAVKGVHIPVGQSKTIAIDLFGDAEQAAWDVSATDISEYWGGTATMELTFDQTSGQNGDKLQLTIRPTTAGSGKVDYFFVTASRGDEVHSWVGLVTE